ncbi:hypothetical protein [Chryseobacterium luteum]|uniref:Uncharacterized protein n=1 Tax=Chryseobacterium luteum TaxID=421531 RepID=A0A085ZBA8_9FLAO|nr:hypothetical protein [Chryseobacterium luteum]KFF01722.1 hypothetical protein IX38_16780 [Chryseobacterium luteum]
MGNKIITEKDFWICSSGAAPAQLQGTRKSNKQKSGEVYITIADTATSSWIDFGCTKNMLMNALIAAVVVIVVVALIVGTGGVAAIGLVGMMAIGAGAAVTAGIVTAVEGALTCGQNNAGQRGWQNYKKDLILTGSYAVTGGAFMECKVGGVVKYSPKVKTWTDALLFAGTSYSLKLVECAAVGAGAGAGGFYMAPVVAGLWGGTMSAGWGMSSIGGNLWGMIYGAKGEMAVMRGAGGADSLLHDWATKDNETAGGAFDAFATGASGEYALGKKIYKQGYVTASDAGYIALYLLFLGANFKQKVPAPTKPKFNPEQNAEFIDTPENLGNPKDPEPPSTPKDGEAFEDPAPPPPPRNFEQEAANLDNDGGHSYADHGAQTTGNQHKIRLETGETPGGSQRATPEASGKFNSHEKHIAAYEDSQVKLQTEKINSKGGLKKKVEIKNEPFNGGTSYTLDANGNLISSPTSYYTAIYKLNPTTGQYELITLYPNN